MLISYMDAAATLPAKIIVRRGGDGSPLTRLSPASEALTDFAIESPISVAPERHVDDALQDMIRAGVRALLVMQDLVVLGLITASDILGTRPIQFLQSHLCTGCLQEHCMTSVVRNGNNRTAIPGLRPRADR
jgi:signal-transduction protein with cAMP-binding, CBS, and nucleotidyltransferase domain